MCLIVLVCLWGRHGRGSYATYTCSFFCLTGQLFLCYFRLAWVAEEESLSWLLVITVTFS